jgi:hypothetical protein
LGIAVVNLFIIEFEIRLQTTIGDCIVILSVMRRLQGNGINSPQLHVIKLVMGDCWSVEEIWQFLSVEE